MRADARGQRRLMLVAAVCGACFSVGSAEDQPTVDVTPPRLLDELCKTNAYALNGAAKRAAGLTEDSCGFELGPGSGSVTFTIDSSLILSLPSTTTISALLVNIDSDGPTEARWVPLENADSSGTTLTNTVTVSTTGQRMGVVDLEVWTSTPPDSSCSMARRPTVSARSRRGPRR